MPTEPTIVTSLNVAGTKSMRLASRKLLGFYGINAQNPSQSMMRCIVPPDGYIFVQPDQSGAEALIVAYEAPKGKFRRLFELDLKVHSYLALQLFTDQFRGEQPAERYSFVDPDVLVSYPEHKALFKTIKNSGKPYDIGKMVIHCLTPDHEVLTETGWIPIANTPKRIACWDNGKITFDDVAWNSFDYDGEVISFDSTTCHQTVTPNHRMLYQTNGNCKTTTAERLAEFSYVNIPTSGDYSGTINVPDAALVAALQADGCILTHDKAKFRFKKKRKLNRLRELLTEAGYIFDYYQSDHDLVHNVTVYGFAPVISWFKDDKKFDWWLLSWDAQSLDALIDELAFWDGHETESFRHRREVFYSQHWQNIEVLKTILHLRGKRGSEFRSEQGHHQLGINRRRYSRVCDARHYSYAGPVYCPTTRSGYFLVRKQGEISVTGNSKNYNMGPRTFQTNVLERSEGKLVISFKDAKTFLATHEVIFPEIQALLQDIREALFATRTLRNLFGYPRTFYGMWTDAMLREAYSFIPQSTVGTITNIAYTENYNYIKRHKLPWLLLNNKHDSFLAAVPDTDEHKQHAREVFKNSMEKELVSSRGEHYKMKSGISWGYNWAKYDEKTNPEGMKEE